MVKHRAGLSPVVQSPQKMLLFPSWRIGCERESRTMKVSCAVQPVSCGHFIVWSLGWISGIEPIFGRLRGALGPRVWIGVFLS